MIAVTMSIMAGILFVWLQSQFLSWQAYYLYDSHNFYHGRHTICMIAVTISIMAGTLFVCLQSQCLSLQAYYLYDCSHNCYHGRPTIWMIAGTRETLLDLERSSNCWRRWRNAGREESSSAEEYSKLSKSTRMVNHQPKPSQQPLTKTNRCHPTKLWKSTRRRVNHQPTSSQQPPTKVNRCQPTKLWKSTVLVRLRQ